MFNTEFYIAIGVSVAISIAMTICVAVGINNDAKAYNIRNRGVWVTLGILFGIGFGLLYILCRKRLIRNAPYYCTSCNTEIPKGATTCPNCNGSDLAQIRYANKKTKTTSVICIILAIVLYISGNVVSNTFNTNEHYGDAIEKIINHYLGDDGSFCHIAYSPANTDKFEYFYDMNKKPYIDTFEVPYFTEDGEEYIYEYRSSGDGLASTKSDEFHDSKECFVDEKGYLIFDKGLYDKMDEYDHSVEKNGKLYHMAGYVSWNPNGELVDKSGYPVSLKIDELN